MGLKYSANEFISLIADGTLHHSDIIDYAGEVDDVKELLISLWLSNIACVESTGKPLVTTCQEERRIDYAISIISKRFNVSVLDDDNELDLPGELNTDNAKIIFDRAIAGGFMQQNGNLYKWIGQKNEFAKFVELSSEALKIRPCNGNIPWRHYKLAFSMSDRDITSARTARNDYSDDKRSIPDKTDELIEICNL